MVGTPGRVKQLIEEGVLKLDGVRLFCLDEADKMMESSFKADVTLIFNRLSSKKQVLALSATYKDEISNALSSMMRNPRHIRLASFNQVLVGLDHYCLHTDFHPNPRYQLDCKVNGLLKVLGAVSFNQALVFTNFALSAENVCTKLNTAGWPAIFIAAQLQDQHERLAAFNSLRQFTSRILVTTDLSARGIDAANVNLVINLDVPWDSRTFLHRSGRAGRYGTRGINVTLVAKGGQDLDSLRRIVFRTGTKIKAIEGQDIPDLWKASEDETAGFEVVEGLECPLEDEEEGEWKVRKQEVKQGRNKGHKGQKEKLNPLKTEVVEDPCFGDYLEDEKDEYDYTEGGEEDDYYDYNDDDLDFYEGCEGQVGQWTEVANSTAEDPDEDYEFEDDNFIIDSYKSVTGFPSSGLSKAMTLTKAKEILISIKTRAFEKSAFKTLSFQECKDLADELADHEDNLEAYLKQRLKETQNEKQKSSPGGQLDEELAVNAMSVILNDEERKWKNQIEAIQLRLKKSGLSVKEAIDQVLEFGEIPIKDREVHVKAEESSIRLAEPECSNVSVSPRTDEGQKVKSEVQVPDFPCWMPLEEQEHEEYLYEQVEEVGAVASSIFPDPDNGLEKYLDGSLCDSHDIMEEFKTWLRKIEANKRMIELQEFQHQMAKAEIRHGRQFK